MKKAVLIFLLLSSFASIVQGQKAEQKIARSLSKYLVKQFDLLAKNSKVGVLFLSYNNGITDTVSTRLGIIIAKELTSNLSKPHALDDVEQAVRNNSKVRVMNYTVDIYQQFEPYLRQYYNPYKKKIRELWGKYAPDYYLQIKYKLDTDSVGNCVVNFYSIELKPGYVLEPIKKTVSFSPFLYTVKSVEDCKRIKELNTELKPVNNSYKKLLSYTGESHAPENIFKIYNISGQEVKNVLYTGEEYFLELKLSEPKYVYIFYYDPYAKQEYPMYVIHPYSESLNRPYPAGTYRFPVAGVFSFSPPASQLYFKIFLTNEKIPLKVNTQNNTQGYIPVITPAQSENFFTNLQKIPSEDLVKILYLEVKK